MNLMLLTFTPITLWCRHLLRWYIMTSPATDTETRIYFQQHDYFGLKPEQVMFFVQVGSLHDWIPIFAVSEFCQTISQCVWPMMELWLISLTAILCPYSAERQATCSSGFTISHVLWLIHVWRWIYTDIYGCQPWDFRASAFEDPKARNRLENRTKIHSQSSNYWRTFGECI